MEPVAIVDVISDLFLHHWEHECFELCQTQGHHQPFSKHYLLPAATLWSHSLLYAMISGPSKALLNKHSYF